jgi:putative ABC transport system permease protein
MLKSLRRKIIGDLKANRGQFFAVWIVVVLGTALYGAMYPSGVNMRESFYRTYDELNYLDFQIQFDRAPAEIADAVRQIDGVEETEGRLVMESGLQLDPDHQALTNLRLVSVPDAGKPTVNQSDITDGHDIRAAGELLLLKSFADKHNIQPGDRLQVWLNGENHELAVAGLAFNPEYLVAGSSPSSPFPAPSTFGVAWLPYAELAAMAGPEYEGQINDIVVHLAGNASEERDGLKKRVRDELVAEYGEQPGFTILGREQVASGSIVQALVNGNFPIMIFFSGVFLAGATVITNILLARIISSERRRIGTMRALGITRRELVSHYLTFGLLIGVSGGIVGSILGYLNSFWVMGTFISYIAGGTLPAWVNTPQWDFILLGFGIAVVGSVFAGVYPAWAESATPPGVALRPATPSTPNALSRISLNFLPRVVRQSIRNMLRVPGRSLGTMLGVIAGATMIFAALVLYDAVIVIEDDYLDAYQYDLRVDLNSFRFDAAELEEEISAVEGVDSAQAALLGGIAVQRENEEPLDTLLIAVDEADPYIELTQVEGDVPFSQADGVWIGNNLQRAMGAEVGDTLTFNAVLEGTAIQQEVLVLGIVSQPVGAPIFAPRSLVEEWTGGFFPANAVFVRTGDTDIEEVRDSLIGVDGVVAVVVYEDFENDMLDYLTYFSVGSLIFGGFGFVLTLAVLFNTVNANLREQREELAIMRSLGTRGREIALAVFTELVIVVSIGLLIGIPLGHEIGISLNGEYHTETFGTLIELQSLSYAIGIISIVLTVFVATLPGLRAVQKVDLGQVSKSQSI